MAAVWVARINRFIEKLFNVKGGPTVVDIESSISTVVSMVSGVEDFYLQGWNRYCFSVGITGGAAQNAAVELHNPLGSGVIAVVERLGFNLAAVTTRSNVDVTYTSGPAGIADFASPITVVRLDGRIPASSSLIATSSTSGVGFATRILSNVVNPSSGVIIQTQHQEIPMLPGSAFIALDTTVAEACIFDCIWRERAMESSESS